MARSRLMPFLGVILIVAVACQEDRKSQRPDDPKCYTPCRRGAMVDDVYVPCPIDGLMALCLGGTTCRRGSCVAPEGKVPKCEGDLGCPEFQTCIEGGCFSTCDFDNECEGSEGCYKHVCRQSCTSSADSCPERTYCSTLDGENGYCMPLAQTEEQSEEIAGAFELTTTSLRMSVVENEKTFAIVNNAPMAVEFTVRKAEHTEYNADGIVVDVEAPLYWLHMGEAGSTSAVDEFTLVVDGEGGEAEIALAEATNPEIEVWNGIIEVSGQGLGTQQVAITYASKPDGQWAGKIYYFGNFGTQGLSEWMDAKTDTSALEAVHNAFVQKWGAFRNGMITYDNFMAIFMSTRTESWRWASMKPPDNCPKDACYPYDNSLGYGEYSDDLDSNPVPTGLVEMPVALNLAQDASDPRLLAGRISSSDTLHYAAGPAIRLTLSSDPTACEAAVSSVCLDYIQSMDADIVVGGRYRPDEDATGCDVADFELATVPWLVPGFDRGTVVDPETGRRYVRECRDGMQPHDTADMRQTNLSLAGSNPLPDGRSRTRHLEVVDGALINQKEMVILFRESSAESFEFLDPTREAEDFTAYGIMVLERNPAALEEDAFEGTVQEEDRAQPTGLLHVECSDEILAQANGGAFPTGWTGDPGILNNLARALIAGVNPGAGTEETVGDVGEEVHYLCHDTGYMDSGPAGMSTECPWGSGVTFFAVDASWFAATVGDVRDLPCQATGTCQYMLDSWRSDPATSDNIRLNPFWRCTASGEVYCEDNRHDLRDGKTFFAETSAASVFVPLLSQVDTAFRYKTAFTNRSGSNVGFAPEVCVPDSNIIPYCYDPRDIQEVMERVDCVLYMYREHWAQLDTTSRGMLQDYLTINFSVDQPTTGPSRDGFEALFAELLVMMGDESYTQAFASRFDLAGVMRSSFEGSLFEPDGINLSGVAGHEMFTLYQAAQYYQLALDRYYGMMPYVWGSLHDAVYATPPRVTYITQETVTNYLDRLIRASTQKSRAWSEVAKRYQGFNRPDLARLVVERAYTATYLESVLITRLMHKIVSVVNPEDKDQIYIIIEQAQRQYKMALLDMRNVYTGITDEVSYFGFSPDYIPFPALEAGDPNAFEVLIDSAWTKTTFAAEKETVALENNREYETDSASFQAELVSIRNNYENQLAELCGTFEGTDGLVYPAITKYAFLDEKAQFLGDPCGFMGNGEIHEAMVQVELRAMDLQAELDNRDMKKAQIDIELNRISGICGEIIETSDFIMSAYEEEISLARQEGMGDILAGQMERAVDFAFTNAKLIKCTVGTSTDCPSSAAALAVATASYLGNEIKTVWAEVDALESQLDAMRGEADTAKFHLDQECDLAEVDSEAIVANLALELGAIDIDILRAYYELKLAFDVVEKLRGQATRLAAEQLDVEELAIEVEAARNDPNVRIYKNDAIINADRAFDAALREAYKATRVYEYYTSQEYEKLDQLFLIRMVAAGDYNLENYIMELADEFYRFEETYGNPDLRVAVLSLRDDILVVPFIEESGESLSEAERLALFQQELTSPEHLDSHGYLTFPFSTDVSTLSPLTRNHKIYYIEAEIVGGDVGDTVGRVYLRQKGTGTVHSVGDETLYYVFPERTAVINTYFNGDRSVFSDESVFVNLRLRDRPYANTLWELVINQRDEEANKDINLESLTDVRLYVYYSDFTEM